MRYLVDLRLPFISHLQWRRFGVEGARENIYPVVEAVENAGMPKGFPKECEKQLRLAGEPGVGKRRANLLPSNN